MCRPLVVYVIFMVLLSEQSVLMQLQKRPVVIARIRDNSDNSLVWFSEERFSGHRLHSENSDATNDFPLWRQKRAFISLGQIATNIILRGARLVKSNKYVQYFIKPGDFKKALDDFDSVKPVQSRTKPHPFQTSVIMKAGRVGDQNLNVIPGNTNKPPSMIIFENNDFSEKIGDDLRKTKVLFYGDYADVMNYMIKRKIFQ